MVWHLTGTIIFLYRHAGDIENIQSAAQAGGIGGKLKDIKQLRLKKLISSTKNVRLLICTFSKSNISNVETKRIHFLFRQRKATIVST